MQSLSMGYKCVYNMLNLVITIHALANAPTPLLFPGKGRPLSEFCCVRFPHVDRIVGPVRTHSAHDSVTDK